jgi:hypothetical protein
MAGNKHLLFLKNNFRQAIKFSSKKKDLDTFGQKNEDIDKGTTHYAYKNICILIATQRFLWLV